MSTNCNLIELQSSISLCNSVNYGKILSGYTDDLRHKSDYEMDQDTSPDRLGMLIKISGNDT